MREEDECISDSPSPVVLREVHEPEDHVLHPAQQTSRGNAGRIRIQEGARAESGTNGRTGGSLGLPAAAGEVAEASRGREHEERDIDVAEDGELVGLLDEPVAALGEGHLPVDVVLDPPDGQLHAPHRRRAPPGSEAPAPLGGTKGRGGD
jgi:hypothetical protein